MLDMNNVLHIWLHVQLKLVLLLDVKIDHVLMLQKQIPLMINAKLIFQIKNVWLKMEEDAELIHHVKLSTLKQLVRQTWTAKFASGIMENVWLEFALMHHFQIIAILYVMPFSVLALSEVGKLVLIRLVRMSKMILIVILIITINRAYTKENVIRNNVP